MPEKEEKEETFEEVFDKVAGESDGKGEEVDEKDVKSTETDETNKATELEKGKKEKEEDKKPTYEELEQQHKTLQGMFNSKSEEFEALKNEKEVKKIENEPKKEEKKETEPLPEEDKELTEYLKEYEYISKNEAKLRRKELEAFKKEIIKEISEKYDVPVKTVEKLMEDKLSTDLEVHVTSIMEAHKDYGTEKQKVAGEKVFTKKDVENWIGTLSPSKKKAYLYIFEDGETEEVIDLLTEYKEANNIPLKKEEEEELTEEEKKKQETEKKRLEEMETVKGKKGAISTSVKKAEDFESAFDEAIEKADKDKKK